MEYLPLALTVSSADCERYFSQMNSIKTVHRSCLSQASLEQLSQIAVNGPSFQDCVREDIPAKAVDFFMKMSNRRVYTPGLLSFRYSGQRNYLACLNYHWGAQVPKKMIENEQQRHIDTGGVTHRIISSTVPSELQTETAILAAEELQLVLNIWEGVVYEADDRADSDAALSATIDQALSNAVPDAEEPQESVTRQPESQPKKTRVEFARSTAVTISRAAASAIPTDIPLLKDLTEKSLKEMKV